MDINPLPFDFSSSFYFEASGDSEEPDSDPKAPDPDADAHAHADDNDDALSCNNYHGSAAESHGDDSCDQEHDHHDNDEKKEDQNAVVYGISSCEDDEMQEQHIKSFVSFDSGQDFADEMEKNRLFWEACLAS
ncbi:hypothetical protein VNO78_20801 [Psophocarpus tetragonolobus]|uniref:Uncharacterized protein n=1 Tax=Psophocarpus tetragonolobus TaxID=3891 RepID=A0AAN9XHG7_PSOTE